MLKEYLEKYLTGGISFCLDGTGYQHNYNPCDRVKSVKAMTLRQRIEGLDLLCTVKGSHSGVVREYHNCGNGPLLKLSNFT